MTRRQPLHRLALLLAYAEYAHIVAKLASKGRTPGPTTMRIYTALHVMVFGG